MAAACGDVEAPASATTGAGTPDSARGPAPRAAVVQPGPTDAELDALVTALNATTDPESRRAVIDTFLAAGPRGLDRLLATFRPDGEHGIHSFQIALAVRAFGEAAVGPLLGLLASDDTLVRVQAIQALRDMPESWAFGPRGAEVCSALLSRLDVEDDRSAALWALHASRPAGHAVAADLAIRWRDADAGSREELARTLAGLGPDATDAWPVVWAAFISAADGTASAAGSGNLEYADTRTDAEIRRDQAVAILLATGNTTPEMLADLRGLLADARPSVRIGALRLLALFGESATGLAPEIAACLADPDSDVMWAAMQAALANPSAADQLAPALAAAGDPWGVLSGFARDPAFAARLAERLPSLDPAAIPTAYGTLARSEAFDVGALYEVLLRHPSPAARALALEEWVAAGRKPPIPSKGLALLDDPDLGVRLAAAHQLRGVAGVPDRKFVDIGLAARTASDESDRRSAVELLASFAATDRRAAEGVVASSGDPDDDVRAAAVAGLGPARAQVPGALDALIGAIADPDDDVFSSAALAVSVHARDVAPAWDAVADRIVAAGGSAWGLVRGLANSREAIPGDHPRLVAALAGQLCGGDLDPRDVALILLRFEGGDAAAIAVIRSTLEAPSEDDRSTLRYALEAACALGERAATLRPALERLRALDDGGHRTQIGAALAALDPPADRVTTDDPDAIARAGGDFEPRVARLLELGAAGRRALVLLAGAVPANEQTALLALLRDVPLGAEIEAASHASGNDADASLRLEGAAVLAPLLADDQAAAVLARVGTRARGVLWSVVLVERRSPGSVPISLASALLRDEGDADHPPAIVSRPNGPTSAPELDIARLQLVEAFGPRIVSAEPTLVPELRSLRDRGAGLDLRTRAAVALWRLTRREDEALPTLRAVLSQPARIEVDLRWSDIGDALRQMRLGADDLAAIVTTLRAASAWVVKDYPHGSGPQTSDAIVPAITAFLPLLERLGPDAAPAVPALRVALSHWDDEGGERIVRTLGAIGARARAAIPDIRVWAAMYRDDRHVARDAIARIEAGAR